MKLLQLTLRDFFWLVLVAALALGSWVRERGLQAEVHTLRNRVDDLTFKLWFREFATTISRANSRQPG